MDRPAYDGITLGASVRVAAHGWTQDGRMLMMWKEWGVRWLQYGIIVVFYDDCMVLILGSYGYDVAILWLLISKLD